jgi:cytochrome oxidase assembly protein ShyY1
LPEPESGPHLGYVGQWILIGITAVVAYVLILRRMREESQSAN